MLIAKCVEVTGVLIYRAWFRLVQTRTMVFFGLCGITIGALMQYLMSVRWNQASSIDDVLYLIILDSIFTTLGLLLVNMPLMAFMAKLTP